MIGPIRAWDIESGNLSLYKGKGPPVHPEDYVVLHGMLDCRSFEFETWRHEEKPGSGWATKVFDGAKVLCGVNIKFDLLHALYGDPENIEAFRLFLARGGVVWDCQLAEYLLDGQAPASQMLSMEEMAVRYGGGVKNDDVKALWDSGVDTKDIPPELLMRYFAGWTPPGGEFEPGDLQNTALIFNGQVTRARKQGQFNLLLVNMGAYAFTVLAKLWGMHVDVQRGEQLAGELVGEIAKLREELDREVSGLPFVFNWGSVQQRSALLFGGAVPYKATEYLGEIDGDECWWCPERDGHEPPPGWRQTYATMEQREVVLDHEGAPVLFKSGKNAGQPKMRTVKVPDPCRPKKRICMVGYKFPGLTQPRPEWQTSTPGVYSTASDVVETLGNAGIPFLKKFAEWQKHQKDLGTYYMATNDSGEQKGMLTLVDPTTSKVHGDLGMVNTITGRLSSSKPNLQNLPREGTSQVKTMFTSRWGEGGVILQDDATALEVYVQANLTGDAALIDDLRAGLDLHCVRLAAWKGVPYEEALARAKGENKELEWERLRTDAKVFSFRRAYGAGAQTIADGTGMSLAAVEELISAENQRWPGIEPFIEQMAKSIKSSKIPGKRFVPHPDKPVLMCQLGTGTYRTPDGKLYTFTEHPAPKWQLDRGTLTTFSPTEIRNYPVQGGGAEVAKAAMYLLVQVWARTKDLFYLAPLINTVHDAVYADAQASVKEKAAAAMHACCLGCSDVVRHILGWDIAVEYPWEINWGPNMADEHKVPAEVLSNVPRIREWILRNIIKPKETA